MTGFDRWTYVIYYMHVEVVYDPRKTRIQFSSANLVSRVKNAVAQAFRVPTFASVVA